MSYRVVVAAEAEQAIIKFFEYIAHERHEPTSAAKVWDAIWQKIATLKTMPYRCPEAPESVAFPDTVRALMIKKTLVVLYRVDEDAKQVVVIGFRHSRQNPSS